MIAGMQTMLSYSTEHRTFHFSTGIHGNYFGKQAFTTGSAYGQDIAGHDR